MKVLLDENCQSLKPYLLDLNWEVMNIKDVIDRKAGTSGVSDDQVLIFALDQKAIIVTKDNGLKIRCFNKSVPFIDLGSPEQEAAVVSRKLKEMQSWKDYL